MNDFKKMNQTVIIKDIVTIYMLCTVLCIKITLNNFTFTLVMHNRSHNMFNIFILKLDSR